jgi:hypothetical protein
MTSFFFAGTALFFAGIAMGLLVAGRFAKSVGYSDSATILLRGALISAILGFILIVIA